MLVHFECIERDKWDIDPSLILEGTMYNLTPLSVVLSTPNPRLVDEKCVGFVDCKPCFYLVHGLVV